jgi:predicted RNase H-like HicB family nuclease
MNTEKMITVKAIWDDEARVWVASSNDVPGLITEAGTYEELVQKLQIMIPEMLQENGLLNKGSKSDIPFHLFSQRVEKTKVAHFE